MRSDVILSAGHLLNPDTMAFAAVFPAGPFTPGFRLIETSDATRSFPSDDGRGRRARDPCGSTSGTRRLPRQPRRCGSTITSGWPSRISTRPSCPCLSKGLEPGALQELRDSSVGPSATPRPRPGRFPLLVLGQGLYYESPLEPLRPLRVPGRARLRRGDQPAPRHALPAGQPHRRGRRDRGPGHGIRHGRGRWLCRSPTRQGAASSATTWAAWPA